MVVKLLVWASVAFAMLSLGCQNDACTQLQACCSVSQEVEGIGGSCGEFASQVKDPDKCRTITRTIHYVYEDQGLEIPAECAVD